MFLFFSALPFVYPYNVCISASILIVSYKVYRTLYPLHAKCLLFTLSGFLCHSGKGIIVSPFNPHGKTGPILNVCVSGIIAKYRKDSEAKHSENSSPLSLTINEECLTSCLWADAVCSVCKSVFALVVSVWEGERVEAWNKGDVRCIHSLTGPRAAELSTLHAARLLPLRQGEVSIDVIRLCLIKFTKRQSSLGLERHNNNFQA